MKVCGCLLCILAAGVFVTIWAGPGSNSGASEGRSLNNLWDFGPVNPPTIKQYATYIYCNPSTARVGDKIILFIEKTAKERLWFSAVSPVNEIIEGPILIVKKGKWTVALRDQYPTPPTHLSREQWLPSKDEIPFWRLHGQRLVFPNREDFVHMQPGDSFVRRIPDLTTFFVTKKDENGIIYVKCFRYIIRRTGDIYRYKETWLPIEGRYRVQYGTSNIVEFEIRQ